MGSGKSSVGRSLSHRLDCPFIDLDEYIENKAGKTVSEIFAENGEKEFRRMELEFLKEVISSSKEDKTLVLSLGGGTVTIPEAAEIVSGNTDCWYLKATVDTLVSHVGTGKGRPILEGQSLHAKLSALLEKRGPIYEKTAHHIIVTDGLTVRDVVSDILKTLFP